MHTGVLFADLRGFTARAERLDAPRMLKTTGTPPPGYAERFLPSQAIIDKVVGDQVMALYLPDVEEGLRRAEVPRLMVQHAQQLLDGRR